MTKVIGIDLGTTNSCVAVMDGGDVVIIPNSEGSRTTPSVVGFTESGERLVGQIAKRQAVTNPENTVYGIKRLIGRSYDSEEARRTAQMVPFAVVEAGDGNDDAWIEIRGKKLSPPEVSAMVLSRMRQTAEDYLGEPVTAAVITVPAYFDDAQRQATKDAGRVAGLDVQRIINEPTAAALAYGLDKGAGSIERIAVYDLGGGTFDISILELHQGVFEVKATNGDTLLGGEDFDQRVIEWLARRFAEEYAIDLMSDRMALQRLKEAAERAKHELSSALETEVNLPFITADATGPKHLVVTLDRKTLEDLCADLIERTLGPCKTCLQDAGLTARQIDKVLLVGGMSRMPKVQAQVREFFGKEAHKGVNPDEVVAAGAAIQGAVLRGEVRDVLLLDVTPLSLGVETAGGVFTRIIEKNSTIPCRASQVFSTAQDNQPIVSVHVLQGEREMAADNKTMTRFELVGIPPAPRGVPQIEVSFDIDANGIIHVAARDLGTGKEQKMRLVASSGLSDEDIERMIRDAAVNESEDKLKKELADLRNAADGLLYTTEKSLEEYGEMLTPTDVEEIKLDMEVLQKILPSPEPHRIKDAIQRLEGSAYRIADAIYGAQEG